jgi:hypothetical protein
MVSQPYLDGITATVSHDIACRLTASQMAVGQDTLKVSVVSSDRWFPGDTAVVASSDGHVLTGEVQAMDICTGELTIRLPDRHLQAVPADPA